jgi:hypothetical protein
MSAVGAIGENIGSLEFCSFTAAAVAGSFARIALPRVIARVTALAVPSG